VFIPPPKVKSAVIRLTRKANLNLNCDEVMFFDVVKTAFNQRRKTMRNSLKKFWFEKFDPDQYPVFKQRPEELSVEEFVELVKIVTK
jgi:16S rRNA (adenine1518-N6/adenine1519-N6)-dimethyltransferase